MRAGQGDEAGAAPASGLKALYRKRWSIACGLRDTKDLRFGMGMGSIHVSTPARRDRLWLIAAFAVVLLTLFGAAGEALEPPRVCRRLFCLSHAAMACSWACA